MIAALNEALLPILRQAMIAMLETVRQESSCYVSYFAVVYMDKNALWYDLRTIPTNMGVEIDTSQN